MARNKKAGSNSSRQGSVTPSVSSVASEQQNQHQNDVAMPTLDQVPPPQPIQSPIPEEQDEDMQVSFGSRHSTSAETPKQVKAKYGAGRRMHQRAGLIFNCNKVQKALKNGNFADRVQKGEKSR
jgi:hypothetical protein